uniref:Uncharacterized protein n=1 Tax=Triticum urartu TaxID=4572 RepID=A0A8R7R0J2_TRIUA
MYQNVVYFGTEVVCEVADLLLTICPCRLPGSGAGCFGEGLYFTEPQVCGAVPERPQLCKCLPDRVFHRRQVRPPTLCLYQGLLDGP